MQTQTPSTLAGKELSSLKELMNLEALACKKAEHYSAVLTDPALQQMARELTQHHKNHFDMLCRQLQCC